MQLNYKQLGAGEPLIILHGLMGSLDNWKTPAKVLSEFFEVFIIDQRNHGKSPHSAVFSYQLMESDLLDFITEKQIKKVNLLGHSMGGKTVMKFAQNHPEKVNKLIVADIGPQAYPVHHEQILKGLNAIDFNKVTRRKDAEHILQQYVPEDSACQFLLKNLYWIEKGKLAWRFNLKTITETIAFVGALIYDNAYEGETLFLKGEKSGYITEESEALIFEIFPQAKIETIYNSGHWLHAEQPKQFTNEVLRFLLS